MKKIIIHMGADKTGTSALQAFFANNISELNENNFSYFYENKVTLSEAKDYKVSGGNAQPLPQLVWLNKDNYDKVLIEQALQKHIDYANGKNILMSAEDFGALDPVGAKYINDYAIKNDYKITIVYYVRAIADHEMSRYQQFHKEAIFNGSFLELLTTKSSCSFLRTIENICTVFGKENLIVKNYDLNRQELIENFVRTVLNIEDINKFNIIKKTVNRSLNDYELLLMQNFNKYLNTQEEAKFISSCFIDNFRNIKTKYKITQEEFKILERKYSSLVEKVNEYMSKDEEPIKLVSDLEIVDEIKEDKLDMFQERMIALMAEMIKKMNSSSVSIAGKHQKMIDKNIENKQKVKQIQFIKSIDKYNIIKVDSDYIAVLQSLGELDFNRDKLATRELIPYIFISSSLDGIEDKLEKNKKTFSMFSLFTEAFKGNK